MTNEQIEKAAQQHADKYFIEDAEIFCNEPWNNAKDLYAKTLADFAKHCISHQWVCVEERLPEGIDPVLVYVSDVSIPPELSHTIAYFEKGAWHFLDSYYYDCKISHWLPIPQLNPEKE